MSSIAGTWPGSFSVTFTTRYFLSLGNVASSLVLGSLGIGFVWYYSPELFNSLLDGANSLKSWIASWPFWSARAKSFINLLLHESSILLVGFTLLTRIIVGLFITLFFKWRSGRDEVFH